MATPVARFVAIGVVSTLAYALLFLVLAGAARLRRSRARSRSLSPRSATPRRTGASRSGSAAATAWLASRPPGSSCSCSRSALTNGALSVLHDLDAHPPRLLEAAVLVLATLAATVTRYVALSSWVFRRRAGSVAPDAVLSLDTQGN